VAALAHTGSMRAWAKVSVTVVGRWNRMEPRTAWQEDPDDHGVAFRRGFVTVVPMRGMCVLRYTDETGRKLVVAISRASDGVDLTADTLVKIFVDNFSVIRSEHEISFLRSSSQVRGNIAAT
jgi:hypothetical protein